MFEHIRFETIEIQHPIKSTWMEQQDAERFTKVDPNIDDFTEHYIKNKQENSFVVEGNSQSVFQPLISGFAREKLLYMHVFSIFDAAKKYYTKRKNFPFFLLLYTYEGKGILEYRQKKYELPAGYGFIIDCREEHTYYTADTHWKHAILHYEGNVAAWLYQQYMLDGSPIFYNPINSSLQENLEKLLLVNQESGIYREYEVSQKLSELLLNLAKEKNKALQEAPEYIRYLQRYLESNFSRKLTIDGLAEFAGVSKYHLEREFKKYVGYSINAYLIELRLARATFLLINTPLSVSEVGEIAGFSSYPNFLKIFKVHMGVTPGEYRSKRGQ